MTFLQPYLQDLLPSLLFRSAYNNNATILDSVLQINQTWAGDLRVYGGSLLYWSAYMGAADTARLLLRNPHVSPVERDDFQRLGRFPLYWAAKNNHVEVTQCPTHTYYSYIRTPRDSANEKCIGFKTPPG